MYRIKNVSINAQLEELGVERMSDLDGDQIIRLCELLSINPAWTNRLNAAGQVYQVVDRGETFDLIMNSFSFSDYMDVNFWNESMKKRASEDSFFDKLVKHENGEQTFKLYESYGIGFYNIKPGEERELSGVTDRWVDDVLCKKAYVTGGMIKLYKDGEPYKAKVVAKLEQAEKELAELKDKVKPTVEMSYDNMSFNQLMQMLKKKTGKGVKGKTREEIIELLKN